ncbi:MAG: ATP-binding cassette domain-containing protein [Holosporales bacterium]|jgi:putative ABC transport system ATP-binding protein|nr:ATP-binding cassette domain-containing protein [Holosporales bacterium]
MLRLDNIRVGDVLKGLNLTVSSGERVLVIGGNGAGKTTLFGVIAGKIAPNAGEVYIEGRNVTELSEGCRTRVISSILQDVRAGMIGEMTILENLRLACMRGGGNRVCRLTLEACMERLNVFGMNLANRRREYVKNLSGGEKQVLSIVMATSADYKLLLLDEVTAALSRATSEAVMSSIERITTMENKTCLMITHDIRYINSFGDRTVELKNGTLSEVARDG